MKTMKFICIAVSSVLFLSSCSAQFDKLLKKVIKTDLSTEDVAAGLKEALSNGTSTVSYTHLTLPSDLV